MEKDKEQLAEHLYGAMTDLLHDPQVTGLLTAVGDAKARVPYELAAPKTRILFLLLADNLTRIQAKR